MLQFLFALPSLCRVQSGNTKTKETNVENGDGSVTRVRFRPSRSTLLFPSPLVHPFWQRRLVRRRRLCERRRQSPRLRRALCRRRAPNRSLAAPQRPRQGRRSQKPSSGSVSCVQRTAARTLLQLRRKAISSGHLVDFSRVLLDQKDQRAKEFLLY